MSQLSVDPTQFYNSIYGLVGGLQEPDYIPHSGIRDSWLQQFYLQEPHLASVVSSVVSIDKNRGWTLTGSDRMVKKYAQKFHNFDVGNGWRYFMSRAAQAYYTTDMGMIGYVVDDPKSNSFNRVDNLDPSRCQLINPLANEGYNLQYQGQHLGDLQKLHYQRPIEYLRSASMPSAISQFNGLGYCSVSRCVELAKLMIAIYAHDQEQLLAKAPKGLLMLKGISEPQWVSAMQNRKEQLSAYERDFYGGIQVLASQTEDIEANLVALSSLPTNFDLETFTNLLMYAYALAFGYPPDEFWPVQFGALGRGKEVEANEQRASSKGVGNFILDLQEELQKILPRSLQFEFKRRDTSGDLAELELEHQKIENVTTLYDKGDGVINRDEARQMLALAGIIPTEWTEEKEESTGSDRDPEKRMLREQFMDTLRVQNAIHAFPHSKIVHYEWPSNRIITIHDPNEPKHYYQVDRLKIQDDKVEIEQSDVDLAIAGMSEEMTAKIKWMKKS